MSSAKSEKIILCEWCEHVLTRVVDAPRKDGLGITCSSWKTQYGCAKVNLKPIKPHKVSDAVLQNPKRRLEACLSFALSDGAIFQVGATNE